MKKLISVFAALALVGSLAAQKKPAAKAPAKPAAPAAPAVAAPAAPAIAAPAAAPAMGGQSGKGMGLFIEGRGTYTLGNGSSSSSATGDVTAATVEYKLSNSAGFGGGATIGFEIANKLALVGSFDYRNIKSRTWDATNVTVNQTPAITAGTSTVVTRNSMVIGLGFRPMIDAFGGSLYAGAGVAYVLPYNQFTETTFSNPSNAAFTATKRETTAEFNSAIGAYGELGYNYPVTENIYVGLGVRLLVATANNDGKKTTVKTISPSSTTETVTEYAASVTTGKSSYSSDGITDIAASVNVGIRF
ncbi:MAG: hypothetical protein ACOY5B_04005 [Spirochaetota bacterium]